MSENMVEISVSEFEEFKFGLETLRLRKGIYHLEEDAIEKFNSQTNQIEYLYKEIGCLYGEKVRLEKKIEILKFQRLSVIPDEL